MTLVGLLDREHQQLVRHDGTDLLLALRGYLAALNEEPDLGPVIARVETEATTALEAFVAKQNELIERTQHMRDELVGIAPEVDDSDMEEPDFVTHAYIEYQFSLAHFDALVRRDHAIAFPTLPNDRVDTEPVSDLINILRSRLMFAQSGERAEIVHGENRRPDLDPLVVEARNAQEVHDHALREFHQASRTLPGVALARLRYFATSLNPEPQLINPDEEDWMGRSLDRILRTMFTPLALVQKAVNGGHLDDGDRMRLDEIVGQIREQIELAHEGITRAARVVQREDARRLGAKLHRVWRHVYQHYLIAIGVALVAAFLVGWLVGR